MVVAVDVFFKIWRDASLEKPVPDIISIATDNCVFLIVIRRILSQIEGKIIAQKFLEIFFSNKKILKLTPGFQSFGKFHSVVSAWADNVYDLDNNVCTGGTGEFNHIVEPCIDVARLFIQRSSSSFVKSFTKLVSQHLEINFCEFEENSNWNLPFLRNSQLHYIASRTWLSLQLFYTLEDFDIKSHITCVDLSKLSATGMYNKWIGSQSDVLEWTRGVREKAQSFKDLLLSTQDDLRATMREGIRRELSISREPSLTVDGDILVTDDDFFYDEEDFSSDSVDKKLVSGVDQNADEINNKDDDTNSSTISSERSYIVT
jgi:hypothetical protein